MAFTFETLEGKKITEDEVRLFPSSGQQPHFLSFPRKTTLLEKIKEMYAPLGRTLNQGLREVRKCAESFNNETLCHLGLRYS